MTKELETKDPKAQKAQTIENIVKAVSAAISGRAETAPPKPLTLKKTSQPREKIPSVPAPELAKTKAFFAEAQQRVAERPIIPEHLKKLPPADQLKALADTTEDEFIIETAQDVAELMRGEVTGESLRQLASRAGALKEHSGDPTVKSIRALIANEVARRAHELGGVDTSLIPDLDKKMDMRVRFARTARPPRPSGANGAETLFSGIDITGLPDSDKAWLQKRIDLIRDDPDGVNYWLLDGWVSELKGRLRGIEDPHQQAVAAQAVESIYGRMQRMSEQGMIPNTITITEEEAREMENNPIWFLENFAQEIEHEIQKRGFDSPVIEQRLHRYRLISEFFSSDTYDKRMGLVFENFADTAKLARVKEALLERKADLLGVYSDRLHVMEFSYALSNVSDFDKDTRFQQLLDRIGDAGAFASRTHWGGLSDVAVNKIRRIHQEILRDPQTAKMKSSLPEVMAEATRRAADELLKEKELWSIQYRHYLRELVKGSEDFIKLPTDIDEMTLDKRSCDAIARIAAGSYQMFFEKQEVMTTGSHPALRGLIEGNNPFITANIEERMTAMFRMRDWFYRKWTNLIGGQKAVWNERAMYYVHKDPELQDWARKKKEALWQRLGEWRKLGDAEKKKDPLFVELRTIFSEYENHLEIDTDDKFMRFLTDLKGDKLNRYVACDIGGEWAQMHGAKPYGFWGSGVRRNVIYRAIQDSTNYKGHVSELFMGRDVLDAANGHFHPNAHRRSEGKRKEFVKVLDNALKYHPHVFVKVRADELNAGMGEADGKRFSEASRRFGIIQSELMFRALAPLDYSGGFGALSDAQRSVVNEVFLKTTEGFTLSKDEYFNTMRGYVADLEGHMDQFTHVRYGSKFAFLLWTDDVPMAALQLPELARAFESISDSMTDEEKKNLGRDTPLSRQIIEGGRGRNGLWRRAWGDFILASTLLPAQMNTLTNDEKKFTEAIIQLAQVIPQYQTNADAAVAVLEASAGYLGAAKVKPGYGEFLKWMKNSSIMKEFWSDKSASMELGEVSETYEKFQNLTGKLRLQSPAYAEAIDSYLGITHWRRFFDKAKDPLVTLIGEEKFNKLIGEERYDRFIEILNENFPGMLYLTKGFNTMPFAILVIMLFAVDQAKKGGQDAKH